MINYQFDRLTILPGSCPKFLVDCLLFWVHSLLLGLTLVLPFPWFLHNLLIPVRFSSFLHVHLGGKGFWLLSLSSCTACSGVFTSSLLPTRSPSTESALSSVPPRSLGSVLRFYTPSGFCFQVFLSSLRTSSSFICPSGSFGVYKSSLIAAGLPWVLVLF